MEREWRGHANRKTRKMEYSDKAKKFLAKNPTLLGRVMDWNFYEDPIRGDEAPLIAITPEGTVRRTDFWEVPSIDEMIDSLP